LCYLPDVLSHFSLLPRTVIAIEQRNCEADGTMYRRLAKLAYQVTIFISFCLSVVAHR